jgi:hypothetical protein
MADSEVFPVDEAMFRQMQRELAEATGRAAEWSGKVELLQESVTDLMLAAENIGWSPLGQLTPDETGPKLSELVSLKKRLRDLLAGNGLAKRGITARAGYIWGNGPDIKATGTGVPKIVKLNYKKLFSARARAELEAAAATDGNIFLLLDKGTKAVTRIPMQEITKYVCDPDDNETITHIMRTWNRTVQGADKGSTTDEQKMWYETTSYTGTKQATIDDVKVDKNKRVAIASFNSQTGWHFGLPDLFAAVWWISSYKQYMEAGFSVTKALAKFTLKATSPTKNGAKNTAAAMAVSAPGGGPGVGVPGYGNMVNAFGASDMVQMSKTGSEFDFSSGEPMAAIIAASLGVNTDVLLARSTGNADVSLDEATVKNMIDRQNHWDDLLTETFDYLGVPNANIRFPPVRTVAVHRAIQAVVLAAPTNALYPEELRGLFLTLLEEYGVEQHKPALPKPGTYVEFSTGLNPQKQADQAAQAAADSLAAKNADPNADPKKAGDKPAGQDDKHPGTTPIGSGTKGKTGATMDGDHSQRKSQ